MQDHEIYIKTDSGREEIASRTRHLKPALRALLLIVDGTRNLQTLRRLGGELQASEDGLVQLQALGLIALRDVPARSRAAPLAATGQVGRLRRLLLRR